MSFPLSLSLSVSLCLVSSYFEGAVGGVETNNGSNGDRWKPPKSEVYVRPADPGYNGDNPPAYEPTLAMTGGRLAIACKVCGSMIDVTEKKEQHVVKCDQCNEATVRSF